jgi:hypothetical protein
MIKIGGENGKQFLVSPSLQESIRCYQNAVENYHFPQKDSMKYFGCQPENEEIRYVRSKT